MSDIVVVGAGQAGASLVARLRKSGFEDGITLVGEEAAPPYQRPPLSKTYLLGKLPVERLYLRPESFYAEQDIELVTGETVTKIDPDAKCIMLGDRRMGYGQLVLTTGSSPRLLPASIGGQLQGVYPLRNLEDVDAMAPEFVKDARILVVGGGYIGLEVAAVAAQRGLHVTVIEMADRILQRVASPETSNYMRELHLSHGVDVRESIGLERLTGTDRVDGAVLSDGTRLDVDFALLGIGIMPNTGLAEAAGLEIDNGIRADAFGRTSAADIWAAGDCASFPLHGNRIRLESVQNAIDQAEAVADNIMGADSPYEPVPWFWSDQYDLKLQIAGLNTGYDEVVPRVTEDGKRTSFWYFRDEKLLAIDAMNDPRAYMVGKTLCRVSIIAKPRLNFRFRHRPQGTAQDSDEVIDHDVCSSELGRLSFQADAVRSLQTQKM